MSTQRAKREAFERSGGFCECNIPSHEHLGGICGQAIDKFNCYYRRVCRKVIHEDSVIVICPECYHKIVASRRKIL